MTCGSGSKARARQCNNPPPSGGGRYCSGAVDDEQACGVRECGTYQDMMQIGRLETNIRLLFSHRACCSAG